MISRHVSTAFDQSRTSAMTPAIFLLYHWQFVFNNLGVGDPPRARRPCNKRELLAILEEIERKDLVQFVEEWDRSITSI